MATILTIEKDEVTSKLCSIISCEKHTIIETNNSNKALELLKENKPDLVVTDLFASDDEVKSDPNKTLSFISELRRVDNKVKIFVYSELCYDPLYRRKALFLGADDCLIKPSPPDTLERTISNLLA